MKKKSLALFATDVGGAIQLFYFATNFPKFNEYKKFFFFKGDSKYLLKKNSIFNNNLNFDLVICATSMNDYEKKVINLAIKKKIENWVMLDNWTNYEKRLVFNGKLLIPNKLLVTDFYAKKLAIKHYPNVKTKQVPNYLLQSLKIVRKNHKKKNSIKKVIFYSSPEVYPLGIDNNEKKKIKWQNAEESNLTREIEYILNTNLIKNKTRKLIVRLHPKMNYLRNKSSFKYKHIIERYGKKMENTLAQTDISVGKDTYALFLTKSLKIPTYSIVRGVHKRELTFPVSLMEL